MEPSVPAAVADARGMSVRVYTLGRFAVEVNGKPLQFSTKSQRKPLLLLKALVAMRGTATALALSEALWPDSDGDQAYGALGVTLRRLRLLIGKETVSLRDGHLSLESERVWVDAQAFASMITAATKAVLGGGGADATSRLDHALDMYRGPFLDGEFEPNEIAAERERLHGLFLRCMGEIGQYYLDANETAAAVRVYQRGLEADPAAEELYRGLMTSLWRQERFAEALSFYGRCEEVLRKLWDIEPAAETQALRQRIAEQARQARAAPLPEVAAGPQDEVSGAVPEEEGPLPAVEVVSGEGERRMATVVMLDIVGYTALTESLDPEELDDIMERVKATAREVVEAHGGIVNQLVGDEVMALFGVPQAQEDDPRRAVQAALALHEAISEIAGETLSRLGRQLLLHTGIATGLLLVRTSGGTEGKYRIIGAAVVTASRLERLAQPGEILLAPETQHEVGAFFHTEPLRPFVPQGREQALVPYRVVRPRRVRGRFEASLHRGLTPYVGREAEMDLLREALDAAAQCRGQLVTVTGEAGLGKSRLLYEFRHREFRHGAGRGGFTVLQGMCQPHARKIPYQPFLDVLRQGLRLRANEPPARIAERLARRVEAIGAELTAYVPFYLHLLSIADERWPLPPQLKGEPLRRALEEALGAIITVNLRHRPMAILMEDWHWCDDPSDDVMRRLAGVIAEYPLLVVVSHRPEYEPPWVNLRHSVNIRLGPLVSAQTERVVLATAGAERVQADLLARIQTRTEGNPLFIEELCRALGERGDMVVRDGTAVLAGEPERLEFPDSVQGIVRSRLDRLAQPVREVLRTAAVIGSEFSEPVLGHMLGRPTGSLGELEALQAQELIQPVRVFPEPLYRFNHAITHDVVYETLPLRTRERLHEQAGQAIETLHGARLEEHSEALAHHYANSGNREKALEYLERAGDKAARIYSLAEARKHYRSAVERIQDPELDAAARRLRVELTLKWSMVSFYVPSEELAQALDAARADAEALGDAALVARVTFWTGRYSYGRGNHTEALELLERCLNMPAAEPVIKALATNYLGRSQVCMARYAEGAVTLIRSAALLEAAGEVVEVLNSMALLVLNYGLTGRFDQVPAVVDRAFATADALQNQDIKAVGYLCGGLSGLLQGDWEAARDALIEAQLRSGSMANRTLSGLSVWGHGYAVIHMGELDEGIRIMKEGIAIVEDQGSRLGLTAFYARLGEVYALNGRPKDARDYANMALDVSRAGEKLGDDVAHCALALVAAQGRRPNLRQAKTHMETSLGISRNTGARSRLAVTLLRQAELFGRHGEDAVARASLKEARALFKDMGMTWYDSQAAALQTSLRKAPRAAGRGDS